MEGDNMDCIISGGGGGEAGSGSRWNPTKEQIDMLEGFYKQGLRTPSADQIQQITIRLKVFGHIEGKNVFYWFQNHKARQRQKQKQENITYYTRLLHKNPVFPSCPNVVYHPLYVEYPDRHGIYQQHPKLLVPRGLKRKPLPLKMETPNAVIYEEQQNFMGNSRKFYEDGFNIEDLNGRHKTLDLFPQQPSGNLQSRNSFGNDSSVGFTPLTSTSDNLKPVSDQQKQLVDFFRQKGHF